MNPHINENISDSPSTLFVTDAKGNILISNEFTAVTVGMPLEELLKCNVQDLVKGGYYNRSITMEAIEKKEKVSRTINTNKGFSILSTATPLLQSDGNVKLVVTTSNTYKANLSKEKERPPKMAEEDSGQSMEGSDTKLVAESLAMKQIIKVCNQITSYESKVLIYGESGTGKEMIAKYIYRKSSHKNGPFLSINCAAIPVNFFEHELFGYEKGAFPGATETKKGMIEEAEGGVLFLDEISEMPLEVQAKLLHVIENNHVRRIGGIRHLTVNCRIISATNRDLWEMVTKGLFREDLYYRINVIPIHVPPLRTRKLDLVGLISHFVAELNEKYNKNIYLSAEEFQKLLLHDWPGNARELKNYIERLVVTDHFSVELKEEEALSDSYALNHFIKNNMARFKSLSDFMSVVEIHYIKQVIRSCHDNTSEAARKLGIHRSAIYRKLKKTKG
jgi:transcriptional regulator with PAS, ATPase and Fis domain